MTALKKGDDKTRADMAAKLPMGSDVTVDGKRGKVVGYALHSKTYIVQVGGDRLKFPLKSIKV